MKSRAKIGNKKGSPAYRTPSAFRSKKAVDIRKVNASKYRPVAK